MGLKKAYDELTDTPEFTDGLEVTGNKILLGKSGENLFVPIEFHRDTANSSVQSAIYINSAGDYIMSTNFTSGNALRMIFEDNAEELQVSGDGVSGSVTLSNSNGGTVVSSPTEYEIQKNGTDGTGVINFKTA